MYVSATLIAPPFFVSSNLPTHLTCAPCVFAAVLFQTYDMNNRAALTSDEVIDVLTIHTDFKALKGADDAKMAAMAGESEAPKPRSKDEIKTFFYTWSVGRHVCNCYCKLNSLQ